MGKVKVVDNTIHSVKIFVYTVTDGKRLFLILKEPEGIYGFVGGAQDAEDETFLDTAKRELKEEVGLTDKSCQLIETDIIYHFMHTDPKSERYGKKGLLHAFLAQYNATEEIKLDNELLEYKWVTADMVLKKITSSYPYLTDVFKKVIRELETKL